MFLFKLQLTFFTASVFLLICSYTETKELKQLQSTETEADEISKRNSVRETGVLSCSVYCVLICVYPGVAGGFLFGWFGGCKCAGKKNKQLLKDLDTAQKRESNRQRTTDENKQQLQEELSNAGQKSEQMFLELRDVFTEKLKKVKGHLESLENDRSHCQEGGVFKEEKVCEFQTKMKDIKFDFENMINTLEEDWEKTDKCFTKLSKTLERENY